MCVYTGNGVFPQQKKVLKQNKTHIPQILSPARPSLLLREKCLEVVANDADFIHFNIRSN